MLAYGHVKLFDDGSLVWGLSIEDVPNLKWLPDLFRWILVQ